MKRLLAATAALTALIVALPALAQTAPGDPGAGIQRGVQELNNSGQVGSITLFPRGAKTLVVLEVHSVPSGKHEPAHLHRGKACDSSVDPNPSFPLGDVVNGRSSTTVNAPVSKLVSGNYVVVVHRQASGNPMGKDAKMDGMSKNPSHEYVSCGLLYQ